MCDWRNWVQATEHPSPHPLTKACKQGCETQNRYIPIQTMFFEILQSGTFCGQHVPLSSVVMTYSQKLKFKFYSGEFFTFYW